MPILPRVLEMQDELTQIRRDIHAHAELGFEQARTSDIVAAKLAEWGCEVHRGLAKTGVVGTIRRGNSTRSASIAAASRSCRTSICAAARPACRA